MVPENIKNRYVVVGDIHGESDGFSRILTHTGLLDEQGSWAGGQNVLIQTGDVIDRGPHSWDCVRLLRRLQRQAEETGGSVIRLCGNHETMLLENPYNPYADFTETELLASELREEIRIGVVQASYPMGSVMGFYSLLSEINA